MNLKTKLVILANATIAVTMLVLGLSGQAYACGECDGDSDEIFANVWSGGEYVVGGSAYNDFDGPSDLILDQGSLSESDGTLYLTVRAAKDGCGDCVGDSNAVNIIGSIYSRNASFISNTGNNASSGAFGSGAIDAAAHVITLQR